ncbi:MAG: glucokinase [Rhodocyclaceae bacterium]|nr:glucokinase [Rhodocyclaceae bacterium]
MSIEPTDSFPRLVGDIGGTNARLALILAPGQQAGHVQVLPCADFPGPREAIEHYLRSQQLPRPRWAALGIANPVDGDQVRMTNHEWAFSIEAVRQALGLERLLFLNDFTALALALPALDPRELRKVGGGEAVAGRAIGLIGAGTGLGISGLVPCGRDYAPIEGEGGHVTLAASNAREAALIAQVARRFPHVSAERILSGSGLVTLYEATAELAGVSPEALGPSDITTRATSGSCDLCVDTVNTFCAMLGTVAADLAVILGAKGGLYIGGGIVPRLGEFFDRSPFRTRFEQKGRFSDYLARIPTFVIEAPFPALLGAARKLEHEAA